MQRYLIAINYDGPHDRLAAEVRALSLADDAQFHIVVPAVASGKAHSEDEQRAIAKQLLDSIESTLDDVPVVDGDVGDANVLAAISDELDRLPYDVLVVATPLISEHEQARLVDHLVRVYRLPVIHVTAAGSEWRQGHRLEFGLGLDQRTLNRGPVIRAARRRRTSRRTVGLLTSACCVLIATTVGAIAWGASQSSASVAAFPSVTATESDFTIDLLASHVAAVPFVLVADNRGPSAHELVVFRTSARDARRAGRAMSDHVSSDQSTT